MKLLSCTCLSPTFDCCISRNLWQSSHTNRTNLFSSLLFVLFFFHSNFHWLKISIMLFNNCCQEKTLFYNQVYANLLSVENLISVQKIKTKRTIVEKITLKTFQPIFVLFLYGCNLLGKIVAFTFCPSVSEN